MIDTLDPQTILCKYPKIFESNYLTQNIRLEIGSLAAWTPAIEVEILPIIGEAYPNVFKEKTNIRTVSAERTFWEKQQFYTTKQIDQNLLLCHIGMQDTFMTYIK